jgi:hypothetical protein
VRATLVHGMPSTFSMSRGSSVVLVCASMPARLRPGRRGESTSIADRLLWRRLRRSAADRCASAEPRSQASTAAM